MGRPLPLVPDWFLQDRFSLMPMALLTLVIVCLWRLFGSVAELPVSMASLMTSRPRSWLYDERRLRDVGGVAVAPPRLDRPTLEGEEPERDRGGVSIDIIAVCVYVCACVEAGGGGGEAGERRGSESEVISNRFL